MEGIFWAIRNKWNYDITLEGQNITCFIWRPSSCHVLNIAFSDYKANHLALYKAKGTFSSEILKEHINILCRQIVEFLDVEPCDM